MTRGAPAPRPGGRAGVFPFATFLRGSMWIKVDRDHRQEPGAFRRRQVVAAITTLVGAATLAWGVNTSPGSGWFYVATLALAAVWAVGAIASGPLHLGPVVNVKGGTDQSRVVTPIVVGLVLAGVFVAGALVVREIPVLADPVDSVLDFARRGSGPLVVLVTSVNALAEELFFRGALYAATPAPRQVVVTTIVYTIVVTASGNVMLGFAAAILGTVVGLQRRASGGVFAPVVTHLTWSLAMLLALPVLFGDA